MDREQKLINDKKLIEDRVKSLEDELRNQIQVNKDLVKKVRLMEYQMLQQKKRIKQCALNHNHQHQNSHQGITGTIGASGASGGSGSNGTGTIMSTNPIN